MMPMTPSGTLTRSMRMPFGRVQVSVTAPTGSLSGRTASIAAATASTRAVSSDSLSKNAPVMPLARASARSSLLAARMPGVWTRLAAAMNSNARYFWAVGASARPRAAARAWRPISAMAAAISPVPSMLFSGALMAKGPINPFIGSYHVGVVGARQAGDATGSAASEVIAGDSVDKPQSGRNGRLIYTLGRQGDASQEE